MSKKSHVATVCVVRSNHRLSRPGFRFPPDGSHMPLRDNKILSSLDLNTQVTVTTVYLEMCRSVAREVASEEYERARHTIAGCVLRLARDGERDPSVMKVKVAEKLRKFETAD